VVSILILIIIFGIFAIWVGIEVNNWWKVRKEYVRIGFAEDKFPYRMYTERELVEKGLWSGESPALNAVPTRTTPEETYVIFRQALIDGDLDKAVECFIKAKQEAWRSSLYEIKNKGFLQEMLNDLPDKLEDAYFYTDDITGKDTKNRDLNHIAISSYYYISKNDPEKMAKTMTFSKDWNGDWKIEKL